MVERLDRDAGVRIVRSVDDDRVDRVAREHLLVVLKDLDSGEVVCCPLPAVLFNVTDRSKHAVLVHSLEEPLGIVASLLAYADDAVPYLVHYAFSFSTLSRMSLSPLYCHVKMSLRVTFCMGAMFFAASMRLKILFHLPTYGSIQVNQPNMWNSTL